MFNLPHFPILNIYKDPITGAASLVPLNQPTIGNVPTESGLQWKAGDRFMDSATGCYGIVIWADELLVKFQFDGRSIPIKYSLKSFNQFARRTGDTQTAPPVRERVCTTCSRNCDVGRCCWWCGSVEGGATHAG